MFESVTTLTLSGYMTGHDLQMDIHTDTAHALLVEDFKSYIYNLSILQVNDLNQTYAFFPRMSLSPFLHFLASLFGRSKLEQENLIPFLHSVEAL